MRRTADECRVYWAAEADPHINSSVDWNSEEMSQLQQAVAQNRYSDDMIYYWDKIARTLGSNRTAIACFRQYQLHLNSCLLRKKWEPEEDTELLRLVNAQAMDGKEAPRGPRWGVISQQLAGRTGQQCLQVRPYRPAGPLSQFSDICNSYFETQYKQYIKSVGSRSVTSLL